ncbi:CHAT domain-containing protein [Flavilitoribacter nigricans]|uniref:CHAT domain-containing protein n=1 Tax=Flavilitoribacter nigricans (strain ATCC 23147 / DSM 23189 / NBRC 102662 / NCIMB 1420 / SS-2) TaxID=1122177 RepID=A0A2D0MWN9_FLAN2|nr:CHAT domain-containing protein [Flavilitoribacter nigricans]PHN00617.1 hypothetical protein CRP01_41290 [Flavilitoribacter nigricans DSM 23189 = NBRC 102662]
MISKNVQFLLFLLLYSFILPTISSAQREHVLRDSLPLAAMDTLQAKEMLALGKNQLQQGDFAGAEQSFAEARGKISASLGEFHPLFAEALYLMGRLKMHLGDFPTAAELHNKALSIRLSLLGEQHSSVAFSLADLGILAIYQGDFDLAVKRFKSALDIHNRQAVKDHRAIASVYNGLGGVYSYTAKYDSAEAYYIKGYELLVPILGEQHQEVAVFINNIGFCKDKKGYYREAVNYYTQGLNIRKSIFGSNHPEVALSYNSLGAVMIATGDYSKAMSYHENALQIRISVFGENHPEVANSYNNLGIIYNFLGDQENAQQLFEKALEINQQIYGPTHYLIASMKNNLGMVYEDIEQFSKAIEYYDQGLKIQQASLGEINLEVRNSHYNLGNVYFKLKDYDNAFQQHQAALQISRELFGDQHPSIGESLRNLALIVWKQGRPEEAITYFEASLKAFNYKENGTLEEVNSLWQTVGTLGEIAQFTFMQHRYQPKVDLLYQSYIDHQRWLAAMLAQQQDQTAELKAIFDQINATVFETALLTNQLLYEQTDSVRYAYESFDLSERSKSLLLYKAMQEADALYFADIPDSLLKKEYDLRMDMTYLEKQRQAQLMGGRSETDTTVLAIRAELFHLQQVYDQLKSRFEKDYSNYYRLKYELATVSVTEIQRDLLQPGQALVEYFLGDSTLFIFLVKPQDYQVIEVAVDPQLSEWVETLRQNIRQPYPYSLAAYSEAAYRLYDILLAPIAEQLSDRLIIIPDGILNYLPFDALLTREPKNPYRPETYDYVMRNYQISYSYSATLLREMIQKQHRRIPERQILAMAPYADLDSIATSSFHQGDWWDTKNRGEILKGLPATTIELDSIQNIYSTDALYGAAATKKRFWDLAYNYRVLHLATHGKADPRVGDYSYLAFAPLSDSLDNELLYVRDLYNLPLNADMVVLSACETGMGELQRGEGMVSMARAFAYAGAKSMVTTLWPVNDRSMQELMVAFYQNLKKGKTKEEALQSAKMEYLVKHPGTAAHPSFWAGVIVIGDTQGF